MSRRKESKVFSGEIEILGCGTLFRFRRVRSWSVRVCHSVADAMRFFRGVQDKDYGESGGLKTVNVRSMDSPYVEVFLRRGNMGKKVF